jgi:hypothetical protein
MDPMPRTTNGQIYRRTINKIKKVLPQTVMSEQLDAMSRVAYYFQLLTPSKNHSLITTAEADVFFSHSVPEIQSLIMQAALENSPLFSLYVIALAARLAPEEWLDIDAALKWAKNEQIPGAYDTYTLSYFLHGLIEQGIWEKRGRVLGRLTDAYYYGWIRKTDSQQTAPTLLIEPTGDVLAPPDTLPATLWELDSMATLVKYDQMTVYHIDRTAIVYAVMTHWSAPSYLAALASMSRVPVPVNLTSNIEDWFRQLSRHTLVHATILHSEDPKDSADAERILRDYVRRRLSPTDLIVDAGEMKQLLRVLDKSGMPVIPHVEEYDAVTPDDEFYEDYDPYLGPVVREPIHNVHTANLQRTLGHALIVGATVSLEVRDPESGQISHIRLRPIRMDQTFLVGVSEKDNPALVPVASIQECEVSG